MTQRLKYGFFCAAALSALAPSVRAAEESQVPAALHATVLYSFTGTTGAPTTGLVAGPGGVFYGATAKSVYELYQDASKKWQVKTLYAFTGTAANYDDIGSLILSGGALYGTSLFGGAANCAQFESRGCGFVFSLTPSKTTPVKWTEKTIYRLTGGGSPAEPVGLASPKVGTLLGLSEVGGGGTVCGSFNNNPTGCGTLFQLTLSKGVWSGKTLYRFTGGKDGGLPMAPPSLDASGAVYYSAYLGGTSASSISSRGARPDGSGQGCGMFGVAVTIFGIIGGLPCDSTLGDYPRSQPYVGTASPTPQLAGQSADAAASANYALVTAQGGGYVSECSALGNNGCGTVLLLSQPASKSFPWTNHVLHRFTGTDGALPNGALLADGNTVYGVASAGGVNYTPKGALGNGVIYALTRSATGFTYAGTAYKFLGPKDGETPRGQLALLRGQIFATTQAGGSGGNGTIVMLAP